MSDTRQRYASVARVVRPLSREQFVSTYSGRRKALYERAAVEYQARGLRQSDAKIKSFIKIESLVKLDGGGSGRLAAEIVPRIIQPRNPRLPVYGYALGRYIKVYEHLMKDAVARIAVDLTGSNFPVVLKGINARRRAEIMWRAWGSFTDPVAISMDASRFDQHVSQDALRWEHSMWLYHAPDWLRPELQNLLRMQLRNRCVGSAADGKVYYTTDGCRMSGDMNTSAGNCMLMSCMLLTYCHIRGVKAVVFNDGDDSVVLMERDRCERFQTGLSDWFLALGFTMEVEDVVDIFERIDFCQCSPVNTFGGWTMVRNPHKALAKDLTHPGDFAHDKLIENWLSAVGECGRALTDGVPVYQSFYRCFDPGKAKSVPEELSQRGFFHMAKGCRWTNAPITVDARVSFYKAFGVTPDDQILLETTWDKMRLRQFVEQDGPSLRWCSPIHPRH